MLPDNLFNILETWTERGWLRPLDLTFTRFLSELSEDCPDLVLLAAALCSHQLGRGHVCLDLVASIEDPDAALSMPPEGETGEDMPIKPSELLAGITADFWGETLEGSELVAAGEGDTPLVLNGGRLYLRRYWNYTRQVAQGIMDRALIKLETPENLSEQLDLLFASLRSPGEKSKKEVHWQSVAAAVAASSSLSVISGGPGTGKTTTVVQLLGLLQGLAMGEGKKLRIRLAAPTGKAAARLTESIGGALDRLPEEVREHMPGEVTTIHRLLGSRPDTRHFVHGPNNPLHVDLLVVDEASMIDLEMMAALLGALPVHTRLILLGDKDQLASVEAGSVLGDLCRNSEKGGYLPESVSWVEKNTGYFLGDYGGDGSHLDQHIVVLRKSHRFGEDSGIGALARAVNSGDHVGVSAAWKRGFGDIAKLPIKSIEDPEFSSLVLKGNPESFTGETGKPVGYRAYLDCVKMGPGGFESEEDWMREVLDLFGRFQLLSPLRKGEWGVAGLNMRIAEILFGVKLISARDGWYSGRPVLVTRNDYGLGLMNGDIGIALRVKGEDGEKSLRAVFPMSDGTLKKVLPSRLIDVETVYAMTVHKSQGSEFEHTVLVMPDKMNPVLTRELVYTGITRARSWFTLASPRMDLLAESVTRRTHRASGLADLFY